MRSANTLGIVLVTLIAMPVFAACDKKDDAKGDPTAASASAAAAGGTGTAAATGTGANPATGGAAPVGTAAGATTVTNTDGTKQVVFDGGSLNLANQNGKGSVVTGPNGATTIQGKSGKTVVIPPIPVPK